MDLVLLSRAHSQGSNGTKSTHKAHLELLKDVATKKVLAILQHQMLARYILLYTQCTMVLITNFTFFFNSFQCHSNHITYILYSSKKALFSDLTIFFCFFILFRHRKGMVIIFLVHRDF